VREDSTPEASTGSSKVDVAVIDQQIATQWAPALLNMMLVPLAGAVDVFWIGQMQDPMALAGQGAANQVYNAVFWIVGFLPTLVTPQVARTAAIGDSAKLRIYVSEAMLLSAAIGLVGYLFIALCPAVALSPLGLSAGSEMSGYTFTYLKFRALSFIPSLCSMLCFATFRGMMDPVTPLRISIAAQLLNAVLDPLLIFGVPQLGVPALGVAGAAMATSASEILAFLVYIVLMLRKKLLSLTGMLKVPEVLSLGETIKGAGAIQLRSLVMTSTFMCITRAVLQLDPTGTSAAAHTVSLQIFTMGSFCMLALSMTASALIPQWLSKPEGGGLAATKQVGDRLLRWGLLAGMAFCVIQALITLPVLKLVAPLPAVQAAAVAPCLLGAGLHVLFGVGTVGEGIQQGHEAYSYLAFQNIMAACGLLASLYFLSNSLTGIWLSYWVYHTIRAAFSVHHHFALSPLTAAKLQPT